MMDPKRLRDLINGRAVYLWGGSIVGFGICRSLERNGIVPKGFIDRSERMAGKYFLGYPVVQPDTIINNFTVNSKNIFIIIASGHYEHEIAEACRFAGLIEGNDFISARSFSPLDPSVDISGMCNLRCISCPRGNFNKQPPAGFMSAATYRKVLDKLICELPFVGNVQLYAWGEPFLNPEVTKIIGYTVERKVLCALSTNLNSKRDFTAAIQARPDWIKVSVSGYGEEYEVTHTGGCWDILLRNLHTLKELRERYHPDMYIEINYHLYKHNTGESYDRVKTLCEELHFAFRANPAYLYPLDHLMAYREKRNLPVAAQRTLEMLLLPIEEGFERAEAQKDLPCAEERCFPIGWDGSVRYCGAWFEPVVAKSYLEEPMERILKRRAESVLCTKCKAFALHRFTSVYVDEQAIVRSGV